MLRVFAGPGRRLPVFRQASAGVSLRARGRFLAPRWFGAVILGGAASWTAAALPAGARAASGGEPPFALPPAYARPPGGERPPAGAQQEGEAEAQEEEGEEPQTEGLEDEEQETAEGEGSGAPEGGDLEEGPEEGAGDEEEDAGPRLAALAAAPTGILPGVEQAAPNPDPGNPVVDLFLEEDGFVALTAGGRVVAFGPEGGRPLWGLMEGRAIAIGRVEGTVAVLERDGGVTVRRLTDGRPLPSLGAPAPGVGDGGDALPGSSPDRLAGWFGDARLLHASKGRLSGRDLPGGAPAFEVFFEEVGGGEGGEPSPARIRAVSFEEAAAAARPGGPGSPRSRRVAVSLGDGGLALLDGASGAVRWRREGIGRITHPPLLVPERDLVVVGSAEGELHAIRLNDGRTRWRRRLYEGFRHPPLASRGRLYAVSEANSVYCFDLGRGGERWRAALPGRPAAAPLRLAGALVVAVRDGLIVELQPEIGNRIGRERRLDAEVAGVVRARADGPGENGWRRRRLYLGLRDGRLAVLGPRTSLASSR